MHVGNALKELDGVADVRVDLAGKSADVIYDESKTDKAKMADAVKEAGYSVLN
jgi:copper chaperone CopZ